MAVDLSNYEEVDERLRKFFEKYPEGSMQTVSIEYRELPADHKNGEPCLHVIYHAAAYRTPDDPRPGQGVASEPLPGLTRYTKGSELMNAETSAWGRALVAIGFVAKKVASANEVRNRQGAPGDDPAIDEPGEEDAKRIKALLKKNGITTKKAAAELFRQLFGRDPSGASFVASLRRNEAGVVIARLEQGAVPTGKSDVPEPTEGEFVHPTAQDVEMADGLFPPQSTLVE